MTVLPEKFHNFRSWGCWEWLLPLLLKKRIIIFGFNTMGLEDMRAELFMLRYHDQDCLFKVTFVFLGFVFFFKNIIFR